MCRVHMSELHLGGSGHGNSMLRGDVAKGSTKYTVPPMPFFQQPRCLILSFFHGGIWPSLAGAHPVAEAVHTEEKFWCTYHHVLVFDEGMICIAGPVDSAVGVGVLPGVPNMWVSVMSRQHACREVCSDLSEGRAMSLCA